MRPYRLLPPKLPKRSFSDQTLIYTYQPPRSFQEKEKNEYDYLIQENVKEKLTKVIGNQHLLTFTRLNLPLSGILKKEQGGYVLEVSSLFSRSFPYGKSPTLERRIPIILPHEEPSAPVIEEGCSFSFSLKGYYYSKPLGWSRVETVYFLLIDCPALEELRERYRLPRRPDGHDFHLLLAIDPAFYEHVSGSYFRINTAYQFA